MLTPDPVRPSQAVAQSKPGNSFNEIALAMFPAMVDQLLQPQSTALVLPDRSTTSSHDRISKSFPQA